MEGVLSKGVLSGNGLCLEGVMYGGGFVRGGFVRGVLSGGGFVRAPQRAVVVARVFNPYSQPVTSRTHLNPDTYKVMSYM